MVADPTVSDLRKTATEACPLAEGSTLDRVAMIANHKASQDALLTDRDACRRNLVRTAILLAHPGKG